MNWSEKYLKEKLPHDGLGFMNTVTMDKLKTYAEICALEERLDIQTKISDTFGIMKTNERLTQIAIENNLSQDV